MARYSLDVVMMMSAAAPPWGGSISAGSGNVERLGYARDHRLSGDEGIGRSAAITSTLTGDPELGAGPPALPCRGRPIVLTPEMDAELTFSVADTSDPHARLQRSCRRSPPPSPACNVCVTEQSNVGLSCCVEQPSTRLVLGLDYRLPNASPPAWR
jgi:hypothetical protein